MLGKRSQHLIRKFSELLVFTDGAATALLDTIGSPRSPFEMMNSKMQSPKGFKSYEFGGVGLGIVVALDKSDEAGYEVVPKHVCTSNLNRSGPIQVQTMKNEFVNEFLVGSPEDYTFVTYHDSNKTITKVYYDSGEGEILKHGFSTKNSDNNVGVFRRNPSLPTQTLVKAESSYPTLDFLSSCYLCKKKLDGRDIYMYRGEKAFCSSDCRSGQIMMDERKEKCRSEASRSVELSSSPYTTRDQMFSTGIVAL